MPLLFAIAFGTIAGLVLDVEDAGALSVIGGIGFVIGAVICG